MLYAVHISHVESGIKRTTSFQKDVQSLDELKTAFLKRFGNINDAPNKALKEKPLVKQFTYSAQNLSEWMNQINQHTRWTLHVQPL